MATDACSDAKALAGPPTSAVPPTVHRIVSFPAISGG
jgi:hypothetical protein